MSSFMNKSLALFVILCVMAPSIYIDARPAHKASEISSDQTHDHSKKTGTSHQQTGDLTQSTMSSQAGGDLTKPSGTMSQTDSTEKSDENLTKKKKLSHDQESEDSTKPSGSSSQVDSSEQPDEESTKKNKHSTEPSGSSSQADPSEQTSEDPTKKGETSQEESGSDQSASPSDTSSVNKTSSGNSRVSTERASTLHATGHYLGKRPSDSWLSANSPEKSNDDVQAAECAYNLRTHSQNFAYFKIDPSKANNHGAPYGTCYATSIAPEDSELVADENYDVFYWNNLGGEQGVGTGPIRNSETGVAGYEDTEGRHFDGENPDKSP